MIPKLVSDGLQVAGPIFFLGMQGSALQTAFKILENKNVNQLSPLPFVSLLTNCIVWSIYGVLKADKTVLVPNAIGIFVGFLCALIYHKFSKTIPHRLYLVALFTITMALKFSFDKDFYSVGLLGCFLAVVVSGSPLATIKTVLTEKSTAALPFLPSVFTWLNSCSWCLYGTLVANDPMV